MIQRSTDGKQRVLSLSYGKDSMACLGAIEQLGWPLDRIITAEIWATDTIQADLPPMVEFKSKADAIILERYGIAVEHYCATKINGYEKPDGMSYENAFYHEVESRKNGKHIKGFPNQIAPWCNGLKVNALRSAGKKTYENVFYTVYSEKSKHCGEIYGFPIKAGNWCTSMLKTSALDASKKSFKENTISYVGIASDEPKRLERLDGVTKISPLAAVGWTEADCMKWCIENDLRSPLYDTSNRGGCWFCHNQGIDQLRLLRRNYPELWALLLKWDADSPVTFKADGHTVHDFEERFALEDEGIIQPGEKFRWQNVEFPQLRWF